MKSGIKTFISFCIGGAIGVLGSYRYFKKKFEDRLTLETASMKKALSNKTSADKISNASENKTTIEADNKKAIKETAPTIGEVDKREYTNYTECYKTSAESPESVNTTKEPVAKKRAKTKKGPRVISPDEFNTEEDYEAIWLTYYADGVLADERDYRVNIEATVGMSALDKIGEYEQDVVHVRNDEKKCDYEISRDKRTFAQVIDGDSSDEEDEED